MCTTQMWWRSLVRLVSSNTQIRILEVLVEVRFREILILFGPITAKAIVITNDFVTVLIQPSDST